MSDDEDGIAGPSVGTLRVSSADLMVRRLGGQLAALSAIVALAMELERWYLSCAALGADRAATDRLLREVQGPRAGSAPSRREREAVLRLLVEGVAL